MFLFGFIFSAFFMINTVHASQSCVMESYHEEVVDTGSSLKEIEQKELTAGACKEYYAEYDRRQKSKSKISDKDFNRLTVLCGKWMFINLGMRTDIGIPMSIYKNIQHFDEVGPRMKKLGFLDDESWSKEPFPFGVVRVKHERKFAFKRLAANKVMQISCAGCHTAELPDGRFSLGSTNEKLDYGKFNIFTMFSVWLMDKKRLDEKRWLPEIIAKYQELDEKYNRFFFGFLKTVRYYPANQMFIREVVGEEPAPLLTQKSFLESKPGIYNGFAPSLNFVDKELYLTAPNLFGVGSQPEKHYGSLAGLETVDDFVSEAMIYTNRSTRYNKEKYIAPLKEYLKCVEAPKNLEPVKEDKLQHGKAIFQASCVSCHNLPNGGGTEAVSPDVIKTPSSYVGLFKNYRPTEKQSRVTYKLIQKLDMNKSAEEIKVRRLNGIWTRANLTSNGQIQGLDHLFCLSQERKNMDREHPKTEGIHADLCSDYSPSEKEALIEYLKHF